MNINGFNGVCTGNNVRVRSSMNTQSSANILKEINKGTKLKLFKKIGNWYEIYFGKNGGFISADYVRLEPINGVVIAKSGLHVRRKPCKNSERLDTLKYGATVKIDINSNNADWYSIFWGQHGGYVAKEYIDLNVSNYSNNSGMVTNKLIEFIKSWEGFYSKKYLDSAGVPTIGYGSTRGWIMNKSSVTKEEATKALMEEVSVMARQIKSNLDSRGVKLVQNQFDALCSFAYNLGTGALFKSTLYKRICAGVRDNSLKENFTAWKNVTINGKLVEKRGLKNRRIEEFEMFMYGDYVRNL